MTRLVSRTSLGFATVLGLLLVLLPARKARALGEDEWSGALQVGGALIKAEGITAKGLLPGAEVARGLTDLLAVRGSLGLDFWDWPNTAESSTPEPVLGATLGALVSYDVLRAVPFAELGVVACHFGNGLGTRAGAELGVGVDYLLTRHLFVGLALRGRLMPLSLGGAWDWLSSGSASLRGGYRF